MSKSRSEGKIRSPFLTSKYLISKTLGQGKFSKVKLALHAPTGEKVAIKILEKKKFKNPSDLTKLSREIQIIKTLKHPNIIQLYEVIETNDLICIILEYMSGGELFDFIIKRGRLNEIDALSFYSQLINAIEYMHGMKIAHRDLKPENLLLDDGFNLKIADFGLANVCENGRKLETPCGSPCYAAPEMLLGKAYNGLKADIWSCGVVLYAMVCGFLPFEDQNISELYEKIRKGIYVEPIWLSDKAKDLIKHVLDANPDTRFSIEDIKNHPWMKNSPAFISKDIGLDYKTIETMDKLGYDKRKTLAYLENNQKNSLTTMYHLLSNKKKDLGNSAGDNKSSLIEQKINDIRREVRKNIRPISRTKITANSISPGADKSAQSKMRSQSGNRGFVVLKELDEKTASPIRKNGRVYRLANDSKRQAASYKSTPRSIEFSYRIKYPISLVSP